MSAILLDGEIVHYEVLGRGRPVLFVHGWVGSWRYWIPAMQVASMSFRAYALDLWGFGDTAKPAARYLLERQVDLIDNFLQEMGILKVALVGHGLGALAGLLYAQRRPDSVDRALAVGLPLRDEDVNSRLRSSGPAELADWLLARGPATDAARMEAPKADPAAIHASLRDLAGAHLADLLGLPQPPRLLVHSQADPLITAPRDEQVNGLPETCHQVFFENSGHFPMLDEGSKFNRLLTDFLNLPSGESPRQLQLKEEWKRRVR